MAKTVDDFASLGAWTNMGGVSISPTGWAYHPGNSTATGYIYRAMGSDTYFEVKTYLDNNVSDWMMLKINTGTSNLYNTTASDGCGIAVRGSGTGFAYLGGTISGNFSAGAFTVSPRPGATTTACTVGIYRRSSTSYDFYCNGVLLGNQTTTQATSGTNVCVGGYNSVGAHFDYVASADHVLSVYEDRNTTTAMVV